MLEIRTLRGNCLTMGKSVCIYVGSGPVGEIHDGKRWGRKMSGKRCVRVTWVLSAEIKDLVDRAITGGRYGSASEYVRALIVRERRRSGDPGAKGVTETVKMGRPKKAA
jgi:hypothetical protein